MLMIILKILVGCVLIAALIEGLAGESRMITIIVSGSFALVIGLWILLSRLLWPNRSNWRASLSYYAEYLEGKQATKWRTGKQQRVGDSFTLDIRKGPNKVIKNFLKIMSKVFKKLRPFNYGKVRVIDKVIFMHGKDALDYPVRWRVILSGLSGILKEFEKADSGPRNHMSFTLEHPEKTTFITIEIIEPRPNHYWSVGDIRIREVRLFGKYWKVDIK